MDGKTISRPAEFVQDGDLVLLMERMLRLRGLDTVRISKVKGHADEALFELGGLVILIGLVIMERMGLLILAVGGCLGGLLMLGVIFLEFVLVGVRLFSPCVGSLSIMMVWLVLLWTLWFFSAGGAPKRRRVVHAVRDRAFLPGPAGIWDGEWGVVAVSRISCHDVELWPYCVSMLVKWVAFSLSCSLA